MLLRILLFDDIPENRQEVLSALTGALGSQGLVHQFEPTADDKQVTHEARLIEELKGREDHPVSLIVADRDLSAYKPNLGGLSEGTVRRVADVIGVPECGYARGERPDDDDYIERGEHREACIRLSLKRGLKQFADQVVAIAQGFSAIVERIPTAITDGGKKTPGNLLARILDKAEYADKISLFASGDQNRLEAVTRTSKSKADTAEWHRRAACLLGYWLWDSVLRFPGVVVNDTAASSYLNIGEDAFKDNAVHSLFASAIYRGPFADAKDRLWWRGSLDDVVARSGCDDGRAFAIHELKRDVPPSQCCENPAKKAGFYCMLSRRPVSLENSKGNLPWFPRGADLARVSTSKLEELGPWI